MADYKSLFIKPGASLKETCRVIDNSSMMIALVVDENRKLLGTVTDGDIRRGLLRGLTLDAPVDQVMHAHPVTAAPGTAPLMRPSSQEEMSVVASTFFLKTTFPWSLPNRSPSIS